MPEERRNQIDPGRRLVERYRRGGGGNGERATTNLRGSMSSGLRLRLHQRLGLRFRHGVTTSIELSSNSTSGSSGPEVPASSRMADPEEGPLRSKSA